MDETAGAGVAMAGRDPEHDPRGFLDRWSKRKVEARREADLPDEADPEESAPQPNPDRDPLAGLPDLESLGPGSDFRPFMQQGVPAELRRAALRKLWRSRPGLANLDGLVDYGEDFTDAARAVPALQTAYQVGRGFLKPDQPGKPDPAPTETADDAETGPENESQPDPTPRDLG